MSDPRDRTEEFIALLSEHSREIYSAILRLVLNPNEADDIYQETNLVLWREFERFESGTNFASWAYRIAVNQVLTWRKKRQRDRLTFGCEFLEEIAKDMDPSVFVLDRQKKLLAVCLRQLPKPHQELIALRYANQVEAETIARRRRQTVNAVYRALQRIRQALFRCMEKRQEQHEHEPTHKLRSEPFDGTL